MAIAGGHERQVAGSIQVHRLTRCIFALEANAPVLAQRVGTGSGCQVAVGVKVELGLAARTHDADKAIRQVDVAERSRGRAVDDEIASLVEEQPIQIEVGEVQVALTDDSRANTGERVVRNDPVVGRVLVLVKRRARLEVLVRVAEVLVGLIGAGLANGEALAGQSFGGDLQAAHAVVAHVQRHRDGVIEVEHHAVAAADHRGAPGAVGVLVVAPELGADLLRTRLRQRLRQRLVARRIEVQGLHRCGARLNRVGRRDQCALGPVGELAPAVAVERHRKQVALDHAQRLAQRDRRGQLALLVQVERQVAGAAALVDHEQRLAGIGGDAGAERVFVERAARAVNHRMASQLEARLLVAQRRCATALHHVLYGRTRQRVDQQLAGGRVGGQHIQVEVAVDPRIGADLALQGLGDGQQRIAVDRGT